MAKTKKTIRRSKGKASRGTSRGRSRSRSSKVLTVDSKSKIPALEKILKSGKMTIVLVFADWCPHCHTFRENIWNPMCSGPAKHNRVAVRDDMVRESSLSNAKFNYLPSVLVVNEKGQVEEFQNQEGEPTNAMPTPKSLDEMSRVVNVNVTGTASNSRAGNALRSPPLTQEPQEVEENIEETNNEFSEANNFGSRYNSPMTTPNVVTLTSTTTPLTPNGKTFTPAEIEPEMSTEPEMSGPEFSRPSVASRTPTPYPQRDISQRGGSLLESLQGVSQGIIPVGILGSLSLALKGGRRISRKGVKGKRRRTHRMIRA